MTITRLVPLSPPWAIAVTNRGPAGVGTTIAVDPDVTVLAPNEPGEVENIGNATHAIFKFSLPKGETGDVGPAPSLDIGTVTTVPNGNAADAEITGGDGDYELNLTIPAGPTGPPPTLDIGDVESGVTADAEITGSDGEYELNLTLPIGPPPVLLPGTVTAVDNGDPLVMTLTETGPGEYTLDIEVPEGPQGVPGSMSPGDAVTLLTMATARMLGRTTAGTGIVQEMTAADVRSFINVADGANVTAAADFANDKRLLRSDGTAKGTQASGVTLSDANVISGASAVYASLIQGAQLSMPDTGQDHAALFQMGTNLTAARTYTLGMPDGSYTYSFPARTGTLTLDERLQRAITGPTDTLALADAGAVIKGNSGSTITIMIPPVASVPFPVGTQIDLVNINTGAIALTPDSGVTLNSKSSKRRIASQWGAATLLHESTNVWVLFGDIVT